MKHSLDQTHFASAVNSLAVVVDFEPWSASIQESMLEHVLLILIVVPVRFMCHVLTEAGF